MNQASIRLGFLRPQDARPIPANLRTERLGIRALKTALKSENRKKPLAGQVYPKSMGTTMVILQAAHGCRAFKGRAC